MGERGGGKRRDDLGKGGRRDNSCSGKTSKERAGGSVHESAKPKAGP